VVCIRCVPLSTTTLHGLSPALLYGGGISGLSMSLGLCLDHRYQVIRLAKTHGRLL
jgi:hypothetical protein